MSVTLMRDLYEYHRWANHRLFDVAMALGEEPCARELGKQFSVPTLTRMFAHVYGADLNWLKRWKGSSPTESPFFDIGSMVEVRRLWDPLEALLFDWAAPARENRALAHITDMHVVVQRRS